MSSVGSTFADEASQALKRLVGRAHEARRETAAPRPVLVLQDAATFGRAPVYIREGGSIPVTASFETILGLPVVLLGITQPGDNAHAPNEKLDLSNFHKGPLHYDRHHGAWRSELDEWQRHRDPPPADSRAT